MQPEAGTRGPPQSGQGAQGAAPLVGAWAGERGIQMVGARGVFMRGSGSACDTRTYTETKKSCQAGIFRVTDRRHSHFGGLMRWLWLPVFVLSATPAGALAQMAASGAGASDSAAVAPLAAALQGHGQVRVRLRTHQPDLVLLGPRLDEEEIRFDRYAPGSWTFDSTLGPHAIPLDEISRVQVRSSAWATGAIIGFLAGAAAIEAVNAAGKYQIDKGETLFIGGLFGTGGAFIGGLIAAPFHHWHTVYASP